MTCNIGVMEVSAPAAASPLPGTADSGEGAPATARRERKKRQLRDSLIRAALELFEAKGYEHTAVHEITDAVDVSERTFFRYFASKEHLVLSFLQDRMDMLLAALAARPATEEPLAAARNAFHDSLRDGASGGSPGDVRPYLSAVRLIEGSPALLAAGLRHFHEHEDEVVGVLARREGVDPAADRRPRLLAALIGAVIVLANHEWREQGAAGPEAMAAAFDAYADLMIPALAGHWR